MQVIQLTPKNEDLILPFDVLYADKEYIKSIDKNRIYRLNNRVSGSRDEVRFHLLGHNLKYVSSIVTRDRYDIISRGLSLHYDMWDEHASGYHDRFSPYPVFLIFDSVSDMAKYKLHN